MTGSLHPARRSPRRLVASLSVTSVIGAAALTCLVAPPASAATAQLFTSSTQAVYYAQAGEVNDITITQTGPHSLTITDAGAEISASMDCSGGGNTVTCSNATLNQVYVVLGDQDDTAVVNTETMPVQVIGQDGDDVLTAVSGVGYLDGGNGDDTLTASADGGSMRPGAGTNTVTGGSGGDSYSGDTGDDTVDLGAGNDYAYPGTGDDDVHGGTGVDTVSYGSSFEFESRGDVTVSLDDVANDGVTADGEVDNAHSDFENISTGSGNDTITGNDAANTISSGGGDDDVTSAGGRDNLAGDWGNDTLNGGSGDDRLNGGYGDDEVFGGDDDDRFDGTDIPGADTFAGGDGVDSISYDRTEDIVVTLDNLADDGQLGESDNVMSDVEDIATGDGDDVIMGTPAANELSGGSGNDFIRGRGGNDGLDGGVGRDNLGGGSGTDSVSGGGNVDTIRTKDNTPDYVTCGSSIDSLERDRLDQVAVDCELLS